MKTYEIGDTIVLLDEIISIGAILKADANYVIIPINLRGGAQVRAIIESKGENEKAGSTSPYRTDFMHRFELEYMDFRQAWQQYIITISQH